jgi:hypothetical protein
LLDAPNAPAWAYLTFPIAGAVLLFWAAYRTEADDRQSWRWGLLRWFRGDPEWPLVLVALLLPLLVMVAPTIIFRDTALGLAVYVGCLIGLVPGLVLGRSKARARGSCKG